MTWFPQPSIHLGHSAPIRTVTNDDDPTFVPLPPVGFRTSPAVGEPLLWEGDNA